MKEVDRARAERAVREFLLALGRDPDGDVDLVGTPARVVEAYANELLSGYGVDVKALLSDGEAVAPGKLSGFVALRGIAVSTICPHHLLLSHGTATVAYRPGQRLFGLGTLAAVVNAFARRSRLGPESRRFRRCSLAAGSSEAAPTSSKPGATARCSVPSRRPASISRVTP